MAISTHLPPPVMIDNAAFLALVTHMLCWSWAMCFSAAASSENDHGSMNLASTIESAKDACTAAAAIMQACANGELSPREAVELMGLVEAQVRMFETTELEARLAALEAKERPSS
jgi:hypothetical protein